MSRSSSEEYSDEPWIFLKDQPQWKDIQPVPQNDGPANVATIAYSEKFQDVHNYLRGLLKMGEKSERALALTAIALDLNAANYTTWKYRRDIIQHLGLNLKNELNYAKSMITNNPKNYQVWHHFKVIIEWIGESSGVLEHTENLLRADSKNYHAWQHRQWVIMYFKSTFKLPDGSTGTNQFFSTIRLFDGELDYVNHLLNEDVRNNSAWNHRYFVVSHTTQFSEEVIKDEIAFTLEKIKLATNNESAWSYLRGILVHSKEGLCDEEVMKLVEKLFLGGCRSPQLLAFLIDKTSEDCQNLDLTVEEKKKKIAVCLQLYEDLANKYDKIRSSYWMYLHRNFSKLYETVLTSHFVDDDLC